MSVVQPDRVAPERVELRQVPAGLARVLADPDADDPDSQSWAHGYPLPGTRVAARNFVQQAEAAGDGGNSQWGMFQIILRETGEVIGDIGFHGPPDEAGTVEIGYSIVEQSADSAWRERAGGGHLRPGLVPAGGYQDHCPDRGG